jgi:hypothetical protein
LRTLGGLMKITILNGDPQAGHTEFNGYLKDLAGLLERQGHVVVRLDLQGMRIEPCIGCWGCWVKTPGRCVVADDSDNIRSEFINSDLVLFASPVIMGFTSALLKKAHDKLIPLLHPYFELVQEEVRHIGRYDRYPRTGLLLAKDRDTDDEDIGIISEIYRRNALNLKTSLCFSACTDRPPEEIAHEIDGI